MFENVSSSHRGEYQFPKNTKTIRNLSSFIVEVIEKNLLASS